jgi:hypothetical protein
LSFNTLAEHVAGLAKPLQEQVAADISAGEDAAAVVRRHAKARPQKHKKARHALAAFLRVLGCGVEDVRGRIDKAGVVLDERGSALLGEAAEVIDAIRRRAAAAGRPPSP